MMDNQLGKNIKHLRELYGETLEEFGSKVLLSKTAISGYETGRRKPDFEKLAAIAEHFGKSIDELLYTDLTVIEASKINNKSVEDIIEVFKEVFPLFSSEELMENNKFKRSYHLCEKLIEASAKGENLNGHIMADILDGFWCAIDETEAPEAIANFIWGMLVWWLQINDTRVMLDLQNKLMSKRIDMKSCVQECQKAKKLPEVKRKKKEFLLDFKEMITGAIESLKSDSEWAELGDYYLAVTFLFDMVDNELSSELNATIGIQMLMAYVELENPYAIHFLKAVFELGK